MRIGMFVDMYKPYLSGVTNHVSLYKRGLEELGHEVFVFTFGRRGYRDTEPNVIRSPGVGLPGTGAQVGVRFSREARAVIRTLDVAHVHHPFVSGRLVLRAARPLGIPVVFTSHSRYDLYSDAYAGYIPRRLRYAYLRRYLDRFCRSCDLVIAPSRGIQDWLALFGVGGTVISLRNAIDTRHFREPRHPASRRDLGFPDDSVVFAYVGRISSEKNTAVLVDAFVRAASAEPKLRLLLVGDGNTAEDSRRRLADAGLGDRAVFVGETAYELVPDRLSAADAFVTASVSEVHPLVVMEAMAAGLPVLGVISPGVSDIVEDGETGLLVPDDAGTAAALAERMVTLARDDELRGRLASRAAEVAVARYDIRPAAEQLARYYDGLLARR